MSLDLTSKNPHFNFNMREVSEKKIYRFEDFDLDADHLLLFRGGEQLGLRPKVVETLLALVERRGEVLSKNALMEIVWPDTIVEESNLSQNLYLLRKTLGKTGDGKPFIETLKRRGYRFNGEITVSNSSNPVVEHKTQPASLKLDAEPSRPVNVERHGNVLAIADWQKTEEIRPIVPKTDSAILGPDKEARPRRLGIYLAAASVIFVIIVSAFGYLWFRSQSNSAQAAAKNDVVFMNLTDGEDVNNATISPDGNFFAYASRDGNRSRLFVQQTGQPGRHEITDPIEGHIWGIGFAPNSHFIYFVSNEKAGSHNVLYRIPTLGGARTKILSEIAAVPSFSPDGNEMVFIRGKDDQAMLVIASSDGSWERTLLSQEAVGFNGGGVWSPDGKMIAYGIVDLKRKPHDGGCTIMAIDPVSAAINQLSSENWDTCYRMAWTSDSKGLVFIGTRKNEALSTRRDQVYYLSIPDGSARRLTTDGNRYDYNSLGVTDKDEILAVSFNRLSQIWSMDTGGSGRDAMQITAGFADGRGGIAPLNDGRVAYLTRNGDGFSLWTMSADGSDRRQLTTEPPAIEELRSPPDGSFFVLSAKMDGWNHIYRVDAEGADLRQLTFGDSYEADSTVSPDGRWIAYNSIVYSSGTKISTLWKIPSDGGEPVKVSDLECHTPHFSPDGEFISCISPDWKTISIVSVETGKQTASFQTEHNPILNVGARWTPDGKALAYIVSSNLVGNILVQPINGEPARALTDFQSGDIYNFAFSPNGSRIYLARGYQTKKAVLIKNFR